MNSLEKVYDKTPDVVTRKIGEMIIIVPARSQNKEEGRVENVFTLNNMAAGIWTQINGLNSLGAMKTKIIDFFEVTPDQAERDLLILIRQLEKAGLVYCK